MSPIVNLISPHHLLRFTSDLFRKGKKRNREEREVGSDSEGGEMEEEPSKISRSDIEYKHFWVIIILTHRQVT